MPSHEHGRWRHDSCGLNPGGARISFGSGKSLAAVRAGLERLVPKLDNEIRRPIAAGEAERLRQRLEQVAEVSIFLSLAITELC